MILTENFVNQKKIDVCEHSFKMVPRDAVFTMCWHIFTLFWSRKTSVIVKTYQISFHVSFIWRTLHYSSKSFLFLSLFYFISKRWMIWHVDSFLSAQYTTVPPLSLTCAENPGQECACWSLTTNFKLFCESATQLSLECLVPVPLNH